MLNMHVPVINSPVATAGRSSLRLGWTRTELQLWLSLCPLCTCTRIRAVKELKKWFSLGKTWSHWPRWPIVQSRIKYRVINPLCTHTHTHTPLNFSQGSTKAGLGHSHRDNLTLYCGENTIGVMLHRQGETTATTTVGSHTGKAGWIGCRSGTVSSINWPSCAIIQSQVQSTGSHLAKHPGWKQVKYHTQREHNLHGSVGWAITIFIVHIPMRDNIGCISSYTTFHAMCVHGYGYVYTVATCTVVGLNDLQGE